MSSLHFQNSKQHTCNTANHSNFLFSLQLSIFSFLIIGVSKHNIIVICNENMWFNHINATPRSFSLVLFNNNLIQ